MMGGDPSRGLVSPATRQRRHPLLSIPLARPDFKHVAARIRQAFQAA